MVLAERGDLEPALKLSEQVLALVDEEGLTGHIGNFYEVPALLYYAYGDLGEAKKYLRLALFDIERYGHEEKKGATKALVFEQLLANIAEQTGMD